MSVEKYDKNMKPTAAAEVSLQWFRPNQPPFRLAGFAWHEQDRVYRRMPIKPKWEITEAVNNLAWRTAGGQAQFQTDSPSLSLRAQLAGPSNMYHMAGTGQCGFDCYIGAPKCQRYVKTGAPAVGKDSFEAAVFVSAKPAMRNITINFPLYQGVTKVEIGLAPDAKVLPPPPYEDARPIVVYGTSITQGGCASRPGMAYPNLLSRRFNRPFINLGFSGNGRGEPEVARIISEIADPACYILDYEANAAAAGKYEGTLPAFIEILRGEYPVVPILVISRVPAASFIFDDEVAKPHHARRAFAEQLVEGLRAKGDAHIYFQDGNVLFGDCPDECTVDGSHPTDLGFWLIAEGLAPVLEDVLAG